MNNMDLRRGRFGMQTKAQDERLCRSQQAACNAGMRPKRPQPGGLPCIRASAALQSLRMEQPFAALCALHPSRIHDNVNPCYSFMSPKSGCNTTAIQIGLKFRCHLRMLQCMFYRGFEVTQFAAAIVTYAGKTVSQDLLFR